MMRLTWRVDNNAKVASVSLIDGFVLDDWGRRRDQAVMPADERPAKVEKGRKAPPADTTPAVVPVPAGENSPQ